MSSQSLNNTNMNLLNKKDIVHYARIIETSNIFDVLELKVRTVQDDWFVGIEKRDKQAFLFQKSDIGTKIFLDRDEALTRVKEAEKNKKIIFEDDLYF